MDAPYQYAYRLTEEAALLQRALLSKKRELESSILGAKMLGRDGSICSYCSSWELELEEVNHKLNAIDDEPEYWEAH